jgi:hypothetical protein
MLLRNLATAGDLEHLGMLTIQSRCVAGLATSYTDLELDLEVEKPGSSLRLHGRSPAARDLQELTVKMTHAHGAAGSMPAMPRRTC